MGLARAVVLLAAAAAAGCRSNPVPDELRMARPLPQHWELASPAGAVWQALVASVPAGAREVARDDELRVLSWAAVLDEDTEEHASLADARLTGRDVPVVVTARAEDDGAGCRLLLRVVYLADGTEGGISHSRGEHERAIVAGLRSRLGEARP